MAEAETESPKLEETPTKVLDPSLTGVLENDKLKWVFVGGKGGSGKTTVCCSLALRLAEVRKSVLLLSTDPSHNVSHAFEQNFSKTPTKVTGTGNLSVMEIDPDRADELLPDNFFEEASPMGADMKKVLTEALAAIPGVKLSLVVYAEVMKMINNADSPEFDVVVFDTLPGGQTALSLDYMPDALEMLFSKSVAMRDRFFPLLGIFQQMQAPLAQSLQEAMDRFQEVLGCVRKAKARLRNPEETTFIAICTPDFLSVYETEKMIQKLCERKIDCCNVIVNQMLGMEDKIGDCKLCPPRQRSQAKYAKQIHELYEDFHVVEVPLVVHDIKGASQLREFSNYMFK